MLQTRYTPSGKRKKRNLPWQQVASALLGAAMVAAFCTFGLKYMVMSDVVKAKPAQGSANAPGGAPQSAPLPSCELSPTPADTPTASPTSTPTPSPSPTPFKTILTEDSEAGKWVYEDEKVRIDIAREQPLKNVVATVAVIARKGDAPALRTAFAEGSFGQNVRARTREIAASVDAVFAINGDYCGYRKDGVIVREGVLYRDKPAREALCLFADGALRVMHEQEMDAEALLAQGLTDTWSFGPILVRDGAMPETFATDVKGKNPRTALGQRPDGSIVAVVVDGRLSGYSEGMTIAELAQYMLDLGCESAYNLDGGMTSCMYFNGNVISTPCGTANKERSLSDIIYVGKN